MAASPPSSAVAVLRDAVRIPARNHKLATQVLLLVASPSALLVLLHYLVAAPVMKKVEEGYEQSSPDTREVRALAILESLFLLTFSFVSFLGMILIVNGSAFAHTGRSMSLKDLVGRVRSNWKRPFITWLCFSTWTAAYSVLLFVLVQFAGGHTVLMGAVAATVAAMLLLYIYVYLHWALALVVSVVEDDCQGMKAAARARELIRGKKLQGFVLVVMSTLLSVPIYVLFYVAITDDDDHLAVMAKLGFGLFMTGLLCLVNSFWYVVITVFYYLCSQRYGDKIEVELGVGYDLVPREAQEANIISAPGP